MTAKPIKWLVFGNSPYLGTGYGTQVALFSKLAKEDGLDPVIFGFAGQRGAIFRYEQTIPVYPGSLENYGGDMFQAHMAYHKPDVTTLLFDVWVYQPDQLSGVTSWCPVDSNPIAPEVADRLQYCKAIWAMSRHGETMIRNAGLKSVYVPHGIDTTAYHPMSKDEREAERAKRGIKPGQFYACMVAANKGNNPARKSFPEVFNAWSQFVRTHPDAVLYVHTLLTSEWQGLDLTALAQFYQIPPQNLKFADPYPLINGMFSEHSLNKLFNAADVHLLPSMGEGFGLPGIECQAAGCPGIVSDFSAQTELAGPGYKVPIYPDDHYWIGQNTHWARPRPSEIVKSLEWAYENRGNETLRQQSREFAMEYNAPDVWAKYMKPAIMQQVEEAEKREARTAARQALRKPADHEHRWAATGLYIGGRMHIPCLEPKCSTALTIDNISGALKVENVFDMHGLDIEDDPTGGVAKIVAHELHSAYKLDEIDFQPGDVVLDLGAQVGVVSCYLAKKHPNIKIYAYEPMPDNYKRLVRNLGANGITNVVAVNQAVSGDGRKLRIYGDLSQNSGGASMYGAGETYTDVESVTLADILERHKIERVKLLKIDVEGAEYEILGAQYGDPIADKIEHVRGEFHTNNQLEAKGFKPGVLAHFLDTLGCEVVYTAQKMADVELEALADGNTAAD